MSLGLRRSWPLGSAVAAAFGTFAFLMMLAHLGSLGGAAGAGLWLGLAAALGVLGSFLFLACRQPPPWPIAPAPNPLVQRYGVLLGAQGLAVLLGLIYWIVSVP
jgi:hypothetical protein